MLNFATLQMKEHKNDSYFDLLLFREKVIKNIIQIEKDIKMKNKLIHAKPSILNAYSNELELLSMLSTLIREKFEIQYISGRKIPEDYYKDMRYFYKVYIPKQKSKIRKEKIKKTLTKLLALGYIFFSKLIKKK